MSDKIICRTLGGLVELASIDFEVEVDFETLKEIASCSILHTA